MPVDIEAVRRRAERFAEARDGDPYVYAARGAQSARDVPALIEEISNLRAALGEERAAHAETSGQLLGARFASEQLLGERDAYKKQIRRLTDQLLMQSPNPGGMTIPGEVGDVPS